MRYNFEDKTISVGSDEINFLIFLEKMVVVELDEVDLAEIEDLCTNLKRFVQLDFLGYFSTRIKSALIWIIFLNHLDENNF